MNIRAGLAGKFPGPQQSNRHGGRTTTGHHLAELVDWYEQQGTKP